MTLTIFALSLIVLLVAIIGMAINIALQFFFPVKIELTTTFMIHFVFGVISAISTIIAVVSGITLIVQKFT
jgi:hypothetical protein